MSVQGDGMTRADGDGRLLSREECEAVWQRVQGFTKGGGKLDGAILAGWQGELRWARNRVRLGSERRNLLVGVHRGIAGRNGSAYVNQLDDESLQAVVRAAERSATMLNSHDKSDFDIAPPGFEYTKPAIWSDVTYDASTEERGALVRDVIDSPDTQGLLAAGYLEMRGLSYAFPLTGGSRMMYTMLTQAQCSMTVRDHRGAGSGWAGLSGYDWGAIDARALAERATQKAIASREPKSLEPGRYTVILEPQAVHDLVTLVIDSLYRLGPEVHGLGPYALGPDPALNLRRTKLGLKVVDERVTIDHDPMDPRLGVIPFITDGTPRRRVTWIDRGVLTALAHDRLYALKSRNDNFGPDNSHAFRMSGGDTAVEEMIRTTKRGLLVTRFSNVRVLDQASLLATGLTRDGLWLIENGKITHPVKNFRFTESPLFVLNSLEQLGPAVPVFRPVRNPLGDSAHIFGLTPAIVPALKARDFSFTSTIDAI
jgi:predicted Zn-dependent protease